MFSKPLPLPWRLVRSYFPWILLLTLSCFAPTAARAGGRRAVVRTHVSRASLNLTRTSLRLRATAHAFVDASLPVVGLLPDEDEDLPDEGQKYELKLTMAQTGEMIDVVYRIGDTYIPEALDTLNEFLRDSHNQEVAAYDPRTFDLLHTVLAKVGKTSSVVDILSGYRSQETNDELRASGTTNAAEHSEHILAKAMDIRVAGVSARMLRDAALSLAAGGVGYYPASQFVHLDVGPLRQWTFIPHMRLRRRVRAR